MFFACSGTGSGHNMKRPRLLVRGLFMLEREWVVEVISILIVAQKTSRDKKSTPCPTAPCGKPLENPCPSLIAPHRIQKT